jgi:hypothetical protein
MEALELPTQEVEVEAGLMIHQRLAQAALALSSLKYLTT